MNFIFLSRALQQSFILFVLISLLSCESQVDSLSVDEDGEINLKPSANAGNNQNIKTGSVVHLDASNSSDPEQQGLIYMWEIVSLPQLSNSRLSNAGSINPDFFADANGEYVLSLRVSDGSLLSAVSYVSIISSSANSAPVANAGSDQNVLSLSLVLLNGSASSDADSDSLMFSWRLSVPVGSQASLSAVSTVQASFTPDIDGRYVASLTVNDGLVSSESHSVVILSSTANSVPVAMAGADQNVASGSQVLLDGSASRDADNDNLSFNWVLARPSGSAATLSNSSAVTPRFITDVDGSYVVSLTVDDGMLSSLSDVVVVTSSAANSVPIARAGADQSVSTGSQVALNGSASQDADNDNLSFNWQLIRPSGSRAVLSSTSAITPTFNADVDGNYQVILTVNDSQDTSLADTVLIVSTTANSVPIANAGTDQSVLTGVTVNLDGSESMDVNGDSLTYSWLLTTKPSGSGASLLSANSITPRFTADVDGDYVVTLSVNDGSLDSVIDSVLISATTLNSPPIANAGLDQNVISGDRVTLDGRGSDDPNNDSLSYSWSITRPAGSGAVLDFSNIAQPTFISDVDGEYLLSLTVNDGLVSSAVDTALITSATQVASDLDLFDGNGSLIGYSVNNESDLPDVARVNGRYRANLTDNRGDKTLHYKNVQGRLDAKLVSFPFEVIARNIGIGTQADSQIAPTASNRPTIFAGVQVHVLDLSSKNSSHVVVGHRGSKGGFTIEAKNTVNGSSVVDDGGGNLVPLGRADLRIVGNADRSLTIYWQSPTNSVDNWQLYDGSNSSNGNLPGRSPNYADTVYVGLITYAQGSTGVPFVGTADSFEIIQ